MGNQSSQGLSLGEKLETNMKLTWTRSTDCSLPLREGQCACPYGNKMYCFGGVLQGQDGEMIESNDLLCFNSEDMTWNLIEAKGSIPLPRSAGSLVCVGDKLYLFGGLSHECGWFDSLDVFDIATSTWSELKAEGPKPSARDKLQAAVVDTCIYYFGGFGPQATGEEDEDWEDMDDEDADDVIEEQRSQEAAHFGWFNDLYKFDTASNTWSQPMHMNLGIPTARAAHAMCSTGRDLVIFGGRDCEKRLNDLHIFNVDTRKWRTDMMCKGRLPEPRSFHSATAVGKRVVVMGGRSQENKHFEDLHVFDTETLEWLQPDVTGDLPAGRGQHSVVVAGNQIILYGGSSDFHVETMMCHKFYGDTYLMSVADVLKGSSITSTDSAADTQDQNGHMPHPSSS